jgi:peptidyl-prolyl cis-trans isomerase D
MLKLIRERAIENPWFFRTIMGLLAITFMISLGWWGSDQGNSENNIAEIGEDSISLDEYMRVYKNVVRFYRQNLKSSFDEEKLRKQVVDQMVDQKLWRQEAKRMSLQVTDGELMESIMSLPGFQQEGQFNPERYRRILTLEKLTTEQFEEQQREEILIDKAKNVVRQSSTLTPSEIEELTKMNPENIDQERENRTRQKREKTVQAYAIALKQKTNVVINEDLF